MSVLLKMSKIYAPTLKENPGEAELASHRLLLRSGMIRKSAAGVYSFLPLGWRSIQKIEAIVREEMDAIGSQEMRMTVLQPAEIWHESGRWNDYGPELMRLKDRHNREFCLGPTHEELITTLVKGELRSYRDLPLSMYQIQVKFRDEIRPRFGLLRGREFIMKDAYSFHADEESLQEHYEEMGGAYGRICDRIGLEYRPIAADSGQIGGSATVEYTALADAGETELVYCDCGYAANVEAASAEVIRPVRESAVIEKVETRKKTTIAQVSECLSVEECEVTKSIVGIDDSETLLMLLIPGDHDLNDFKVEQLYPGFRMLTDEEIKESGLKKGFLGPVNVSESFVVVADQSLRDDKNFIVGANEYDAHLVGASLDGDFNVQSWVDIISAAEGDVCPSCGKQLFGARGIEVSQIFQLGSKYSKALGATFSDVNGEEKPFLMGCYGVGVSRSLAAVVEQYNDERGICWPLSIAPAEVAIVPLSIDDEVIFPFAVQLAESLSKAGIEVVLDDRDDRPGVKFADADLIGWPFQIIVGKKGMEQGIVEFKTRQTAEKIEINVDEIAELVITKIMAERIK